MTTKKYDVVIVGAGHNGLIAGTYLAKKGKKVAVVEKRHCIGGAAVTEELYPGFKFSRASYLLALLRKVLKSGDKHFTCCSTINLGITGTLQDLKF